MEISLAVTVDLENSEIQKSDKELFIGFSAIQCIQKNNVEGTVTNLILGINVDSIDWYSQNSAHMQCLSTLRLNNLFRECRATIAGILFSCLKKGLSRQLF
jgi:hypothetical protein